MQFLPSYAVVEAPGSVPLRTAFVLHGMFGSVRNWKSFLQKWIAAAPTWRAVAVDLRHHGESRGAPPPNTLRACAEDLQRLAEQQGLRPDAVVAHSFGGKVALEWARSVPKAPRDIWILDSPPGAGPFGREPDDSVVGRVLEVMRHLPAPVARRGQAAAAFAAAGVPPAVSTWMASSLRAGPAGYAFDFDLDALGELLADYWRRDLYSVLELPPEGISIHAVIGDRSTRFGATDRARHTELARQGIINLHHLANAGHWLHVDNPTGLIDLLGLLPQG